MRIEFQKLRPSQHGEMDRLAYGFCIFSLLFGLLVASLNSGISKFSVDLSASKQATIDFYTTNYHRILESCKDEEQRTEVKVKIDLLLHQLSTPTDRSSSDDGFNMMLPMMIILGS